ncbi:MAG: TerB family tellurite resistance protein [Idiomarina sp.]
MFRALQELIRTTSATDTEAQEGIAGLSHVQVMSVALMLEIAQADHQLDDAERTAVLEHLQSELGLSETAADDVFNHAQQLADDAVSLRDFTQHVKQGEYDERVAIFKALWQTAYADGTLDPHEEAMLRKIADLLYISHADYIRLKIAVLENSDA